MNVQEGLKGSLDLRFIEKILITSRCGFKNQLEEERNGSKNHRNRKLFAPKCGR